MTIYTKLRINNFDKMDSIKKFRFDSFATEFACKDLEDVADSDSGIGKFKLDQFFHRIYFFRSFEYRIINIGVKFHEFF